MKQLASRFNQLAVATSPRKFDSTIRRILARGVTPVVSAINRQIRNKDLVDSGAMRAYGKVRNIPPKQQLGRPWRWAGLGGRYGYPSIFLEEGTVDRYTKKGLFRGKISNPKHLGLIKTSAEIALPRSQKAINEHAGKILGKALSDALKAR